MEKERHYSFSDIEDIVCNFLQENNSISNACSHESFLLRSYIEARPHRWCNWWYPVGTTLRLLCYKELLILSCGQGTCATQHGLMATWDTQHRAPQGFTYSGWPLIWITNSSKYNGLLVRLTTTTSLVVLLCSACLCHSAWHWITLLFVCFKKKKKKTFPLKALPEIKTHFQPRKQSYNQRTNNQ